MGSTYRFEGVSSLLRSSHLAAAILFLSSDSFSLLLLGTTGEGKKEQHSVTVSAISFIHPPQGNQLLQLPSSHPLL